MGNKSKSGDLNPANTVGGSDGPIRIYPKERLMLQHYWPRIIVQYEPLCYNFLGRYLRRGMFFGNLRSYYCQLLLDQRQLSQDLS